MDLIIKSIILIKELAHMLIYSICGINLSLGNTFANQCVCACIGRDIQLGKSSEIEKAFLIFLIPKNIRTVDRYSEVFFHAEYNTEQST